jgi:hypothetical protein
MTSRLLTLEDVALVGSSKTPSCTPYGYIIDADGRTLALRQRFYHGVLLAILYPELAAKAGYSAPAEDPANPVNVFHYQRFELDHSREMPVIRLAMSQLTGEVVVSTGRRPTETQLTALLACLKQMGLRGRDSLTGEEGGVTVTAFIQQLREMPIEEGK